jgi:hypothetical protein
MDAENAGENRNSGAICRELNSRGARYVVIGGFAIIASGFPRVTADIDL